MIKNIVFDLGNVIICFDKDFVIKPFANTKADAKFLKTKVIGSDEWLKIDDGSYTEEQAFGAFKNHMNERQHKLAVDFSKNWYKNNPVNKNTMNIAYKLKENGYKLFVLSNIGQDCYSFFEKNNKEFFDLFDGIIISAREKVKKPDPRIFEILLKRFNLIPTETLLIDDDDTGSTFKTANSLGINGSPVKKNSTQSVVKLLKNFNIKID